MFLLLLLICNWIVAKNAEGKLYSEVESAPQMEVGLLLGTAPQTRLTRKTNTFFNYRIEAAEMLYKAGKIRTILISGDESSLDGVNEVECMRDSLLARGVSPKAIILDGQGFRTLDAVVRATKVFDKHSYIVISQKFHDERALFLAEHLGLDVQNVSGFIAKASPVSIGVMTYVREYFARVKVFIDIFTRKQPLSRHCTVKEERNNLVIYTPQFSNINLVCGKEPDFHNECVIFSAEAAFTGDYLEEFDHANIAGDHVSSGNFNRGYECPRNTGAFVYYCGEWKFLYLDYSHELDSSALYGGMGFCQEMMIHEGHRVQTTRPDENRNEFRALCELKNELRIIDCKGVSAFGEFIQLLLNEGVTEALYLDMGEGWNYSWWRDQNNAVHKIHKHQIPFTTNYITFYK